MIGIITVKSPNTYLPSWTDKKRPRYSLSAETPLEGVSPLAEEARHQASRRLLQTYLGVEVLHHLLLDRHTAHRN